MCYCWLLADIQAEIEPVDFIFMLKREDQTVEDCLELVEIAYESGVTHMGFKDVGVDCDTLQELNACIRKTGATSYMEVVSTTPEACLASTRTARDIGVDRLLGGTQDRKSTRLNSVTS